MNAGRFCRSGVETYPMRCQASDLYFTDESFPTSGFSAESETRVFFKIEVGEIGWVVGKEGRRFEVQQRLVARPLSLNAQFRDVAHVRQSTSLRDPDHDGDPGDTRERDERQKDSGPALDESFPSLKDCV